MRFRMMISLMLIALPALAAVACGPAEEDGGPTLGSADIIGVIKEVLPGGGDGISGTFLLEVRKPDPETPSDQYWITVPNEAPVYRQVGEEIGDLGEVGFGALAAGQRAEVWITGPVAESFPMQATAEFVVIVGRAG